MMDAFNDGMIEGKQVTYSDCKSVALMENSMPLWDSVGKKKKTLIACSHRAEVTEN